MYCRKCGQLNIEHARFCAKCGQPLEQLQQPVPKKKGKRILLISLIVAAAVLILVLICAKFILLPARDDQEKENESWKEERVVWETENETEAVAEEVTEVIQETEEIKETGEPAFGVGEYSELCERMGKLEFSTGADQELLKDMASTALQMEYARNGNGSPKKLYTDLGSDDESVLVYGLFKNFAYGRGELFETTDYGPILKIDAAKQFVRDFYGKENIDFSAFSYLEDLGNGYMEFAFGDGDPWYQLENYSVKENDNFYLLEGACSYEDNGGDRHFVGYAKYLFRKNEESSLGVTLVYSEFDHQENVNLAVSAETSSTLKGQGQKTYRASNLLDGDTNTCWVEGVSGTGVGETIKLELGKKQTVYGLIIFNGYLESKYLYGINGKVTKVSVSTADGTKIRSELWVPEYEETKEPFDTYEMCNFQNWINFDQPVYTDTIIITIEGAVAGSKYEDICISEIQVY